MNKTYLKYLFKSKKSLCIASVILYLLVYITCFVSLNESKALLSFVGISVVLGLLAYLYVPLTFNYVHSKKAVDSYFSLPVSRKEMLITSQTFIDIVVLIPYIILSIISFILEGMKGHLNSPIYAALMLLVAIIGVIVTVMFVTSVFLEANSTFDGIVLIAAYSLMPLLLLIFIGSFQENYIAGFEPINVERITSIVSLPTSIIWTEADLAGCLVSNIEHISIITIINFVISIIGHSIVGLIGLKRNYIERKMERAETISNRFFSYPFVIYAYTFGILFLLTESYYTSFQTGFIIIYLIVFILFSISIFVYNRKIKLRLHDILFFILTIALSLGFSFAAYKTKGFGISNTYKTNYSNIAVEARYWGWDNYESDEISKLIKEKYPTSNLYEYTIDMVVKRNHANDEAIQIIENKRKEAIEKFYDPNREMLPYTNSLLLSPDCDEQDFIKGNYVQNSKKDMSFFMYNNFTIDELKKINEVADIYISFPVDGYASMKQIQFYELIK